jgi:hypothetical protein
MPTNRSARHHHSRPSLARLNQKRSVERAASAASATVFVVGFWCAAESLIQPQPTLQHFLIK